MRAGPGAGGASGGDGAGSAGSVSSIPLRAGEPSDRTSRGRTHRGQTLTSRLKRSMYSARRGFSLAQSTPFMASMSLTSLA
jgi:hypothetical protein